MTDLSRHKEKIGLSTIILTFNEELHLERALRSVADFSKEVFVIDSFSTDRTLDIARAHGATVLQNKFVNQAKQFQWALDNAQISGNWILRLDADEIIESDLAIEIAEKIPDLPSDVVGINLKRKHIFMGRWVKHGGRYPLVMLRIWRKGYGRMENRWMDEHIVIFGGKSVTFEGGFADHNLNNLTFFTDKHNKYATREAIEILNQRMNFFPRDHSVTKESTSLQTAAKFFIKEHIYNHIPFTVSAPLYFLWRYIFQLGFLDGRSGLVYHFLQGYWYRFLVGSKVLELERALSHLNDKDMISEELSLLTGYTLKPTPDQPK
ncbi:glycosyltransferase family 2 protein [Pseudomonas psychrophila]|uniref:glycosyltransferase family 2 protein n=1 Tax=Pseudomonas psychrophila TaxID=122355 RepID=UPI0002D5556F|nr:glycosyltransferase family 2 protein [Pseudomonas psychrophila]